MLTITIEGEVKEGKTWLGMIIADALNRTGIRVRTLNEDSSENELLRRENKLRHGEQPLCGKEVEIVMKTWGRASSIVTNDYAKLEVHVLSMALKNIKEGFDPTWWRTVRRVAAEVRRMEPVASGLDQSHSDALEDVSAWLEKAGNALEQG